MTQRRGRDYPAGCTYQPDEPPLQMTVEQLIAVRDAVRSFQDEPGAHAFDDFLIMNGPYRHYIVKLLARALWPEYGRGRDESNRLTMAHVSLTRRSRVIPEHWPRRGLTQSGGSVVASSSRQRPW